MPDVVLRVLVLAVALVLLVAPAAARAAPPPPPPPSPPSPPPSSSPSVDPDRVLDELLAPRTAGDPPGTVHREFTTTLPAPGGGRVRGDIVEIDLTNPAVRVDLLRPGAVAATATVPAMAEARGAVIGVNGGFFDQGGTGAPAATQIVDGAPRSSGVVPGRRAAPPVPPGESPDTVLGVDGDGVAHIGRAVFRGSASWGGRTMDLRGVNGFVVPPGAISVFTPAWGAVSRAGTVCGSETDPRAGCSRDAVEVRVTGGRVSAIGAPGPGAVPAGAVALVGRDAGAVALRTLAVGDAVDVDVAMTAPDTPPLRVALGAVPLARDGRALPGLQESERAPRTAAGLSRGGRTLWLVTVDGRQEASVGATLAQLGRLVTELGVGDAVALDGGGSTTMVRRGVGEPLRVINSPSADPLRAVTDGLAVVGR